MSFEDLIDPFLEYPIDQNFWTISFFFCDDSFGERKSPRDAEHGTRGQSDTRRKNSRKLFLFLPFSRVCHVSWIGEWWKDQARCRLQKATITNKKWTLPAIKRAIESKTNWKSANGINSLVAMSRFTQKNRTERVKGARVASTPLSDRKKKTVTTECVY